MVRNSRLVPTLLLVVAAGAMLPFASGRELRSQTSVVSSGPKTPQAKVQEELDRYLEITTESDPHRVLQSAALFVSTYPNSELLGRVYQAEMRACENLGDFAGVLVWGRKATAVLPADWEAPLRLAEAVVNHAGTGTGQTELLDEAAQEAREALARLERARPARDVAMQTWKEQKSAAQSRSHEVLGLVAVRRGRRAEAVDELEAAVRLQPIPSGAQMFRLGVAYSLAGRKPEAEATLRRAADAGPDAVRVLAERELKRVSAP